MIDYGEITGQVAQNQGASNAIGFFLSLLMITVFWKIRKYL